MITIRTLKPVREFGESHRDHVTRGGYSLGALEALLRDADNQPGWRDRADKAHAYYDMGKQRTPTERARLYQKMGFDPRETNLIHGVINSVLGTEARQRSDTQVSADDDEFADVSDVLSLRMEEATRESNADMAVSDGYAGQVKGGIGWVEVSRATDPLEYPYRVTEVHRRQIWYDWRSEKRDLSDARWLVRKKWEDVDEAVALFPQHKDLLMSSVNDDWVALDLPDDESSYMRLAWTNERNTTIRRDEWCDSNRQRIRFYEVWYRVPAEVVVLWLSPTRRVAYNPKNPVHQRAVSSGVVRLTKSVTRQMRMALFAGPHRLIDIPTTRRRFPYIPFFGFRDDEDRSPYGLIEGMISPQDSYNERRTMVDWMLKARQLYIDNDALDEEYNSIEEVEANAGRPDQVVVMNANRKNVNGVRVENTLAFQKEQLEVMMNDKQAIQDVPRVYGTQLGDAPAGVTSGVAIQSLTEAGVIAMGEMNDNYRFARKMVHEDLMQLIVEDHAAEELKVMMGSGDNRRIIVLNSWDPQTGAPLNRVEDAPIKVGLSDIPTSPAFRAEEQRQLTLIVQALAGDPEALNILAPAFLEGSSITNRKAMADELRRAKGVPVAADRAAQQAAQQKQAQVQAEQEALMKAAAQLDLQDKASKVEKTKSETELNNAKTIEIGHGIGMSEALADQTDQQMALGERARREEMAAGAAQQEAARAAQVEDRNAQQQAEQQRMAAEQQAQAQQQPQPSEEDQMIESALQEALAA